MSFRYSNVQYTEMVRTLALCNDNVSLACRCFRETYDISVSGRTMSDATRRLREYGTFRPPTGIDRGANPRRGTARIQDRILDYFHKHPEASIRATAPIFNCSPTFVWTTLRGNANTTVRGQDEKAGTHNSDLKKHSTGQSGSKATDSDYDPGESCSIIQKRQDVSGCNTQKPPKKCQKPQGRKANSNNESDTSVSNQSTSIPQREKMKSNVPLSAGSSLISTPTKRNLLNIITMKVAIIKKQRLHIKKTQAQNRRLKEKLTKVEDDLKCMKEKCSVHSEEISVLKNTHLQDVQQGSGSRSKSGSEETEKLETENIDEPGRREERNGPELKRCESAALETSDCKVVVANNGGAKAMTVEQIAPTQPGKRPSQEAASSGPSKMVKMATDKGSDERNNMEGIEAGCKEKSREAAASRPAVTYKKTSLIQCLADSSTNEEDECREVYIEEDIEEDIEEETEEEAVPDRAVPDRAVPDRAVPDRAANSEMAYNAEYSESSIKRETEDCIDENEEESNVPAEENVERPPTDEEIKAYVEQYIAAANLEKITMKTVYRDVYNRYPNLDIAHRKKFIKETVNSVI